MLSRSRTTAFFSDFLLILHPSGTQPILKSDARFSKDCHKKRTVYYKIKLRIPCRMLDFLITPFLISNAQTGGLSEGAIRQGCRISPIALISVFYVGVIRKTTSETHKKRILWYTVLLLPSKIGHRLFHKSMPEGFKITLSLLSSAPAVGTQLRRIDSHGFNHVIQTMEP